MKPILFGSGMIVLIVLFNGWITFVDDSWFTGKPMNKDVIQLSDILLLLGIGVVYLVASAAGRMWRRGAPRIGRGIRTPEREKFEEEENKIW